jgi:hypothetical protein
MRGFSSAGGVGLIVLMISGRRVMPGSLAQFNAPAAAVLREQR